MYSSLPNNVLINSTVWFYEWRKLLKFRYTSLHNTSATIFQLLRIFPPASAASCSIPYQVIYSFRYIAWLSNSLLLCKAKPTCQNLQDENFSLHHAHKSLKVPSSIAEETAVVVNDAKEQSEETNENPTFNSSSSDNNSTCDGDRSSFCQLGVKFGYCSVKSYRTVCCDTCKQSP